MLNDQIVVVIIILIILRLCLALLYAIHSRYGCEIHYFGTFEEIACFLLTTNLGLRSSHMC